MKFRQVHDKTLPWKLAIARKAVLSPLVSVSTFFREFLSTWWEVFAPQGRDGKEKK